ncbi:MAG: BlaI/MecI/CopY family transcriptional regulator [Oscillospiraceae bacterium]|nr:BlaI/MecI/CopY family transcriptional regulator [Oscillospiraceae bacterium]
MEPIRLKSSEWNVLSCLWEESPQTVMQLVARLGQTVGWAKSTTITTLRRMEEKGLVNCEIVGKGKSYTPAVEQENAEISETRSFLNRVYQGSVGMMMSAMAKRQELTKEDISELRRILEEAEGGSEK